MLAILTPLVVAFMAVASVEPQISRNLADATAARYVAEAGIEIAFSTLLGDSNWNSYISGGCSGTGRVLGHVNTALPGLTGASGTYTVSIRNDCQAGDDLLTGVALDTGGGSNDTNGRLILTSAGTFRTATRTVQVVVSRVANVLSASAPAGGQLTGALSLPGVQTDTFFSGGAFSVDGRDYTLADTLTGANPVYAITVPSAAARSAVQAALSSSQTDVTGRDATHDGFHTVSGNATVAADGGLTSQAVADFVNRVKGVADVRLYSDKTKSGLVYANIGASCGANVNDPTCWGTTANPKIVYVYGDYDPTSLFTALKVSGTSSGAGILIVDNGDFVINDTFRWVGLIIVTGKYVGVGVMGSGTQEILGALISNEMASDEASGFYEAVVGGSATIRASRAALNTAAAALAKKIPSAATSAYLVSMSAWMER